MIGAGTVINPIIKVATTVAILAAVYFFFVKPALDTTEHISDGINQNFGNVNRQINHAFDGLGPAEQVKITKTLKGKKVRINDAQIPSSAQAQLKIAECVQRVAPDTAKMQACVNK